MTSKNIQTELKLTQEGVGISVYDMDAPRGHELITEHWHTWGETGLTLQSEADAVQSYELIVRPNGTVDYDDSVPL